MKATCVLGLDFGDEGKGKIVSHLLSQKTLFGKNKFNLCVRYNGGHNAGHSIILNGQKIITHIIPGGILHGIKSIIGHGCVLNPTKFFDELKYLQENGVAWSTNMIKIAYNTHIITQEHIEEDSKDTKIGTTKQGNGPCYRDKYARTGIRAEDIKELKPFLIDMYEELQQPNLNVLFEGAQGFHLDINWGPFYPYLTSSSCGVSGVIDCGVQPKNIKNVVGVCKAYTTYVGAKKFQPDSYGILENIQKIGKEFGATTGRVRQVNFLDLDRINKSIDINGVDTLIINKMDILNKVGGWRLYKDKYLEYFISERDFKSYIKKNIRKGVKIIFSYSPERI